MLKEIVIHVGPAKTGTTTIQSALARFRNELLSDGIYYPETTPPTTEGQHALAWNVIEEGGSTALRWGDSQISWDEALAGARQAAAPTLLVSSEYFTDLTTPELKSLRALLGDLPITVVFGLRDPVAVVCSHWQQAIKWGTGDGEQILPLFDAIPLLLRRAGVLVRPFVDMALACLPQVRVRFFTVPRRPDSRELLRRFGDAAGFPEALSSRLSALESDILNESLSDAHCQLLLELNQILYVQNADAAVYMSPDRLDARDAILAQVAADACTERTTIEVTGEARRSLVELRHDIRGWLAAQAFPLYGSLDDLGPLDEEPASEVAVRAPSPDARETWRGLIGLLANTVLSQARALAKLARGKAWNEQLSQSWENEARRLGERISELVGDIAAITAARDWHAEQRERWQAECQRILALHSQVTDGARDLAEAHERLSARLDQLTRENKRLRDELGNRAAEEPM